MCGRVSPCGCGTGRCRNPPGTAARREQRHGGRHTSAPPPAKARARAPPPPRRPAAPPPRPGTASHQRARAQCRKMLAQGCAPRLLLAVPKRFVKHVHRRCQVLAAVLGLLLGQAGEPRLVRLLPQATRFHQRGRGWRVGGGGLGGGGHGRGRHLVGRNRRRVVRIKGVEPEEHPHCPPTRPPRQRGRTTCCAPARRHVLQRGRPAARGASGRPAGCSDSHGCRCPGAARTSGLPRPRPRGAVPAVALAGWPFTAQALRGDRCWHRCMYACSRRACNRNSRDCGQTVVPNRGKRRMRGAHTNCTSRWRATVRNDGNLVPSPSRLVKPSGRAAPEPALLGRFVLLEAPLAQLARASCL